MTPAVAASLVPGRFDGGRPRVARHVAAELRRAGQRLSVRFSRDVQVAAGRPVHDRARTKGAVRPDDPERAQRQVDRAGVQRPDPPGVVRPVVPAALERGDDDVGPGDGRVDAFERVAMVPVDEDGRVDVEVRGAQRGKRATPPRRPFRHRGEPRDSLTGHREQLRTPPARRGQGEIDQVESAVTGHDR